MAVSRDWDELQHTWVEWRRRSGMKLRDLYEQLIDLSNYAARLNSKTSTETVHISAYVPLLRGSLIITEQVSYYCIYSGEIRPAGFCKFQNAT